MTSIRNSSLRNAVRLRKDEALRAGRTISERDLIRQVVTAPVAEGYFVGVEHAVKMLRRMRRGNAPEMSRLRSEMWAEIAAKVAERQAGRRERVVDSVSRVLDSAVASRYFITEVSASRILRGYC